MTEFNKYWDEKMMEYQAEAEKLEDETLERHQTEMEEFEKEILYYPKPNTPTIVTDIS